MVLNKPAPVEQNPLIKTDIVIPEISDNQILVKINVCGVCHTDLHVVEGDIPLPKLPIVPGHQIVGTIAKKGNKVKTFKINDRVGIPWLYSTCGVCSFCRNGLENLCEDALFTGMNVNGGFAEYVKISEKYAYHLPDKFTDFEAAPLLCAGIIGLRALKLSKAKGGMNLGLFGFGASAHITIQIANHLKCRVFVFTRESGHKALAKKLGAVWVGEAEDTPPESLDTAIIFAPVGRLVLRALQLLKKGGSVILAGIHSTPIPKINYSLIYGERSIKSVANFTREDAVEFLKKAAEIPVKTEIEVFPLEEANKALKLLKASKIRGAAVLQISGS